MTQVVRTLGISLLLALACSSGTTHASATPQAPPSAVPNAIIPEPIHDFGVVRQGERLAHAFVIRNDGTAPLEIARVELSVPGARTAFPRTIAPGTEARIRMEWDTSSLQGEFEADGVIYLNDPQKPKGLIALKAVVRAPIEFEPNPQVFFSAYRDEAPERVVRIVNHEDGPLTILRTESPSEHYEITVATIKAGFTYDVHVRVRPGLPFGRYPAEPIYLFTDSLERPRLQLAANLLVKPDFYAAPEIVLFDGLRLEVLKQRPDLLSLVKQTVTVSNRRGAVEIARIETDVPALEIARTPATGVSDRFSLTIGLAPDRLQPGPLSGTIRIIPADPSIAPLTIPVRGELR